MPRVVPSRATANAGTQAVLKALRGLDFSKDLIGQVAKGLQPLVGKKVSSRERQMARLKEQLHHLRVHIARQVEALLVHTEQSELMVPNSMRAVKSRPPWMLNTENLVP